MDRRRLFAGIGLTAFLFASPASAQIAPDSLDGDGAGLAYEQHGGFHLEVGGYGSMRFEANDAAAVAESFTLRRFVLETEARWEDRLTVVSEIEYERLSEIGIEREIDAGDGSPGFEQELEGSDGSEIALEQAWAQFDFTPAVGLRFGAVLPPVGRLNAEHDDDRSDLPRRPLIDRGASVLPAPAAWTELGLGLVGETRIGGWDVGWQAFVINGVQLDFAFEERVQSGGAGARSPRVEVAVRPVAGAFNGTNDADAFAGRIAVGPTRGTELAVSGYAGQYTPPWIERSATLSTVGVDGRARVGPVVFQGEALWTRFGGDDRVIVDFARVAIDHAAGAEPGTEPWPGSGVEVSLNGISARRRGFWLEAGVPLPLPNGAWGLEDATLIPVARYERASFADDLRELDFSGGAVTTLERHDRAQERWTTGIAFRPMPRAVFQLAYERNHAVQGAMIDPAVVEKSTNGLLFGMAVGF